MLTIYDVKGIGPTTGTGLTDKGITTAEQLANSDVADLLAVPGIGEARAALLIAAAKDALSSCGHIEGGSCRDPGFRDRRRNGDC